MAQYDGLSQWTGPLSLPEANQPADPVALSDLFKALADRTTFLHEIAGKMGVSPNPMRLRSTDGATVDVGPLGGIAMIRADTPHFARLPLANIGVAQLEFGQNKFDGGKIYYVYVKWDNALGPVYVISLSAPAAFIDTGNVNTDYRFVGEFSTTAAAKIRPFVAWKGGHVRFNGPQGGLLAGSAITTSTFNVRSRGVPEYACTVAVRLFAQTRAAPAQFPFAVIGPKGADLANGEGFRIQLNKAVANEQQTVMVEHLPLGGDRELDYFVDANTTGLTVEVMGYDY